MAAILFSGVCKGGGEPRALTGMASTAIAGSFAGLGVWVGCTRARFTDRAGRVTVRGGPTGLSLRTRTTGMFGSRR